ncbi:hypothetical protein JCM16775_0760 [Leptotrichia hofstadii]|uniref:Uncharacterized protein n=2 Tax=Leptotrichia hofstadii TaxID=157688 RepID=A0A510JJN7_9FUSO|nr:hypothetical protein JCM16775_0760 [Leptotrichia hofstadii]
MKKNIYNTLYIITLIRNIQLLFNSYSNTLTGFWLLINLILSFIFFTKIFTRKEKFNEYFVVFIFGFTCLLINYSSFKDWNKKFNTYILIILIILTLFEFIIIVKPFIKIKDFRKIFLLILSFFCGKLFLYFLTNFYMEPRKIVYSTDIIYTKNNKELRKIIEKMPMVNEVEIIEKDAINPYSSYYENEGSLKDLDEIINVQIKNSIDNESMDLLANRIKEFVKLQDKEKKFIKIYFTSKNGYYEALKIYDLKNNELKQIYVSKNLQVSESLGFVLLNMYVKMLKGNEF